ncbi:MULTISPECIES: hypothetical protein [unclassified Streptomyces]|uniref:hypothetical protein n=1 Tax=unclassified Streptomyces TaxID=2593676 RepID=UPI0036B836D2
MEHSDPAVLEALDLAWDAEDGVLGKLRDGRFDAALAEGYVRLLHGIEIEEGAALHADFVRLVWFAPLFSEWQIPRVAANGGDAQEASNFSDKIRERVMELLGAP